MELSLPVKANTEVSEGNTPLVSRTEWAEATKPLKNLGRTPMVVQLYIECTVIYLVI